MQRLIKLSRILLLLSLFSASALLAQQDTTTPEADAATTETVLDEGVPTGPPVAITEDTLAHIRQRGVLQVGIATYTPWAMHDAEGKLIGFEVDVAQQLASDIGVEIDFHLDGWADLLPDLIHGDFDVIIAGMSITPQRALLVNFSNPYNFNETTLLASRQMAENRNQVTDFNQPEMIIGVWQGSVGEELAAANFPEAEIRRFESDADMFSAVREGDVHAVIASSPRPQFEVLLHPEQVYLPLRQPLTVFGAGMVIRKGDGDFLRYLDSWVLYHTLNGWLAERRGYWFDALEWLERLQDD